MKRTGAYTSNIAHRYSFYSTADSIGGSAWAGQLLNGATITSNAVFLSAASSSPQAFALPAGVIPSYATAFSIEGWVSTLVTILY